MTMHWQTIYQGNFVMGLERRNYLTGYVSQQNRRYTMIECKDQRKPDKWWYCCRVVATRDISKRRCGVKAGSVGLVNKKCAGGLEVCFPWKCKEWFLMKIKWSDLDLVDRG